MTLTGGASAEVIEAYSRWSASYDRDPNRTRDLDRSVTRRLLGQLRFKRIVELGCGTGKNTALLAEIGAQVLALDLSSGMLDVARAKLAAAHVAFVQADLTQTWPRTALSSDLVLCNLVLEHIEHMAPVFEQAARSLVAGGMLLVCELHPFRQYQGTQARFADASGQPIRIPAHVHHVSDYFSAATQAGLVVTRIEEWWHDEDTGKPPRLISLCCHKPGSDQPA